MGNREKLIMMICLVLLLSSLSFVGGFYWRQQAIWPTQDLLILRAQLRRYMAFGLWVRDNELARANVSADEEPVNQLIPEAMIEGYRVITGYDRDTNQYSARLFSPDMNVLHVWPLDRNRLLGREGPSTVGNPHGMAVLPDGTLIVNYSVDGPLLAHVNTCGDALWAKDAYYHHSIDLVGPDHFWTWLGEKDGDGHFQSMVKLNVSDGQELMNISLEDVASKSTRNRDILALPADFAFSNAGSLPAFVAHDIFHPNDLEVLSPALAPEYPDFAAGDLMISLRNINLVAVLDPVTLEIKWSRHGPWRAQHDPDFVGENKIEIYDNNPGRGRSNIVQVDAGTGESMRLLNASKGRFFSGGQGKHQKLPNGARLVTVPQEGRVIEFGTDGDPVMIYNNVVTDGANGIVLNAKWLPMDYFDQVPNCTQ